MYLSKKKIKSPHKQKQSFEISVTSRETWIPVSDVPKFTQQIVVMLESNFTHNKLFKITSVVCGSVT